ncbi:AbrB/MazE/SpoVT family DNA-binding domain-containing protein [Halosimplex halobium]|uniref:AbrB/MazE/SpoVT family DNA-binding domain-containing protein n=1 Tax=Halosimplex halobium TaxID=3396618 RepID=UPI003F562685
MKRQVQKLGSSTVGVSVPAEWAQAQDIDESDQLIVRESKSGDSLLLIPESPADEDPETRINAETLEQDSLERVLVSQYVLGRQLIHIDGSDSLDLAHCDGVTEAEKRLMGLNVVEQNDDSVTIRCSVAPSDFDITTLLERLHRTEASMRASAVSGLTDGNAAAARTVAGRYRQVEKLYFLFLRLLFATYRNPRLRQAVGLEAELPIIGFRSIASDILSMADTACDIASIVTKQDGQLLDPEMSERIGALHDTIDEASDIAFRCIETRDQRTIKRAHDTFDQIDEQVESTNEHLEAKRPEPLLTLQRSVTLLERTARYAENSVSVVTDMSVYDPLTANPALNGDVA